MLYLTVRDGIHRGKARNGFDPPATIGRALCSLWSQPHPQCCSWKPVRPESYMHPSRPEAVNCQQVLKDLQAVHLVSRHVKYVVAPVVTCTLLQDAVNTHNPLLLCIFPLGRSKSCRCCPRQPYQSPTTQTVQQAQARQNPPRHRPCSHTCTRIWRTCSAEQLV